MLQRQLSLLDQVLVKVKTIAVHVVLLLVSLRSMLHSSTWCLLGFEKVDPNF